MQGHRAWHNSCPVPRDCGASKTHSTRSKRSPNLLSSCVTCIGNLEISALRQPPTTPVPGGFATGSAAVELLPGETQAYVRLVTGHSAEEWAAGQKNLVEMSVATGVACSPRAATLDQPIPLPSPPKAEPVKPWGAEVAGGPTQPKALARYRELQLKYPAILAGREPLFVVRGIVGDMGAVRARVGAETRADAAKLCAALRAVNWYCDALRN